MSAPVDLTQTITELQADTEQNSCSYTSVLLTLEKSNPTDYTLENEEQLYQTIKARLMDNNVKVRTFHMSVLQICFARGLLHKLGTISQLGLMAVDSALGLNTDIVENQEFLLKAINTIISFDDDTFKVVVEKRRTQIFQIIKFSLNSKLMTEPTKVKVLQITRKLLKEDEGNSEENANFFYESIIPLIYDKDKSVVQSAALDIAQKLLPKMVASIQKSCLTWEKFQKDVVDSYIPTCMSLVYKEDLRFSDLWIFILQALDTATRLPQMANRLLSVIEKAFKGQTNDVRKQAFICWQALIDNTAQCPRDTVFIKRIKLMMVPLRTNNCRNEEQIAIKVETWCKLMDMLNKDLPQYALMVVEPFLYFCFGPLGKKYPSMHLNVCCTFLKLMGMPNDIVDTSGNTFLNNERLMTREMFVNIYKSTVFAVGECTIMLSQLDHKKASAMNDYMWKMLFDFVGQSVEDLPDVLEKLATIILALVQVCVKKPELASFSMKTPIKCLTSERYKFCSMAPLTQNLFAPLASKLSHNENILHSDIEEIFEMVLVYKKSGPDFLQFIQQVLNEMHKSAGDQPSSFHSTSNKCGIWCCLVTHVERRLKEATTSELSDFDSELMNTLRKVLIWPALPIYRASYHGVLTKWTALFESCMKIKDGAPFKFTRLVLEGMMNARESNALTILSIAKFISVIFKNLNITEMTEDSCSDICEILNIFTKVISTPCIVHEVKSEFSLSLTYLFDNSVPTNILPKIEPYLLTFVKYISERNKILFPVVTKFIESHMKNDPSTEKHFQGIKLLMAEHGAVVLPVVDTSVSLDTSSISLLELNNGKQFKDPETPVQARGSHIKKPPNTTKITPAKASVSLKRPEDDSQEYVLIDSTYNFDPKKLTPHQKEMLKRRRDDIPALYADLSQSQSMDFCSTSESTSKENMEHQSADETGTETQSPIARPFSGFNTQTVEPPSQETQEAKGYRRGRKRKQKMEERKDVEDGVSGDAPDEGQPCKKANDETSPKEIILAKNKRLSRELRNIKIDMVGCNEHNEALTLTEKRKTRVKVPPDSFVEFGTKSFTKLHTISEEKKPKATRRKSCDSKEAHKNEAVNGASKTSCATVVQETDKHNSEVLDAKNCSVPVLNAFETVKPGEQLKVADGSKKVDVVKGSKSTSPLIVKSPSAKDDTAIPVDTTKVDTLEDTETLELNHSEIPAVQNPETPVCRKVLFEPSESTNGSVTPEIVTSPLRNDTPSRNQELLDDTMEMSPIQVAVDADVVALESASIEAFNTSQQQVIKAEEALKENAHPTRKRALMLSGRGAQMMGLVAAATPDSGSSWQEGTPVASKKAFKVESAGAGPSGYTRLPMRSRIQKIMVNLDPKQQVGESVSDGVEPEITEEDMFAFTKNLPSPTASPSCGILRLRRDSDSEDAEPPAKRKRVNFADPPVSCKKFIEPNIHPYIKTKNRKRNVRVKADRQDGGEVGEPSDPSSSNEGLIGEVTVESGLSGDEADEDKDLNENDDNEAKSLENLYPICSRLMTNKNPIKDIIPQLAFPNTVEHLNTLLRSSNVNTIGELARLTELQIYRIPLKVETVKSVLKKYLSEHLFSAKRLRKMQLRRRDQKRKSSENHTVVIEPEDQSIAQVEKKARIQSDESQEDSQVETFEDSQFESSAQPQAFDSLDVIPSTFDPICQIEEFCTSKEYINPSVFNEVTKIVSPVQEIIYDPLPCSSMYVDLTDVPASPQPVSPSTGMTVSKSPPTPRFSPKLLENDEDCPEEILNYEVSGKVQDVLVEIMNIIMEKKYNPKFFFKTLFGSVTTINTYLVSCGLLRVHHLAANQTWNDIIADIVTHIGIEKLIKHVVQMKNVPSWLMMDYLLKYARNDIATEFICNRLDFKELLKYVYRNRNLREILTDFDSRLVCETIFGLASDPNYAEFKYEEVLKEFSFPLVKTPEDVFSVMVNLSCVEVCDIVVRKVWDSEVDQFLSKLYRIYGKRYEKAITDVKPEGDERGLDRELLRSWSVKLGTVSKNVCIEMFRLLAERLTNEELTDLYCMEIKKKF